LYCIYLGHSKIGLSSDCERQRISQNQEGGLPGINQQPAEKIEIGRLSCWKPIVKSDLNDKKYGKEK
jgi:hypothetical protein